MNFFSAFVSREVHLLGKRENLTDGLSIMLLRSRKGKISKLVFPSKRLIFGKESGLKLCIFGKIGLYKNKNEVFFLWILDETGSLVYDSKNIVFFGNFCRPNDEKKNMF